MVWWPPAETSQMRGEVSGVTHVFVSQAVAANQRLVAVSCFDHR
jgi:hypothetical protein